MKTANRMAQLAAVVAAAMFLCAASALAGDCPELVGVWDRHWARSIAVSGTYAYVGDPWGSFLVVDVSDPEAPVDLGRVSLGVSEEGNSRYLLEVTDIVVSGDYAYVVFAGWLWVIDVSDPSDPHWVGFASGLGAVAVAVEGDYAYVAQGGCAHLAVIDISIPSSPMKVGELTLNAEGWVRDVAVAGGHAWLVVDYLSNTHELVSVDVGVASQPVVVSGYPDGNWAHEFNRVTLDGSGFAYLIGWNNLGAGPSAELRAIDVRNPQQPKQVWFSSVGMTDRVSGIALERDHAYVTAEDQLFVLDVTDPISPFWEGRIHSGASYDVTAAGGHVYVANGNDGMTIYRDCAGPLPLPPGPLESSEWPR